MINLIKNISIKHRLIITNMLMSMVPLIIYSFTSYNQMVKRFEEKLNEYSNQAVQQIGSQFENYLVGMERVSFLVMTSSEIHSLLDSSTNTGDSVLDKITTYNKIVSFLGDIRVLQPFSMNIYLYSPIDKTMYSTNTFNLSFISNIEQSDWFINFVNDGKRGYATIVDSINDKKYIYILRNIFSVKNRAHIATVIVEIPSWTIERDICDANVGLETLFCVINETGDYILGNLRESEIKDFNFLQRNSGSHPIKINAGKYLMSLYYCNINDWIVVVVIPSNVIMNDFSVTITIAITIITVLLVVSVVVSLIASHSIFKPIQKLRNLMKLAETGNFDIHFIETRNDEIGQLGHSFNLMIKKIKELINEVYEVRYREKETELRALQAQINPHFLYNTLEAISMTAMLNNDMNIVRMINTVSIFFRYNTYKGSYIVELRKEIEHTKSYFDIQSFRFKDRFSMDIDISEKIMCCKTIRLILQPIVENAITHGLKNKNDNGIIKISGTAQNGKLIITVEDNGTGMTEETINMVLGEFNGQNTYEQYGRESIGLHNVNARIKLYYGNEYGLKIFSKVGEGTNVTITIPEIY